MLKLLKFVPLQLVLFLIVGILISSYVDISIILLFKVLFVFILLFVSSIFLANKKGYRTFFNNSIVYVVMIFIGMISFSSQTGINQKNHYSNFKFKQDSINEFSLIITKNLKENNYNYRYEVELYQLNTKKATGKLLLSIKKDSLRNELNINDRLFVKTKIKAIQKPQNPGEFNYKNYLKNRQIYHQLRISSQDYFQFQNPKKTIQGYAFQVREKINKSLKESGFENNELAVINALLLGQRQTIDKDLLDDYTKAGAIHILAVSGLHIGIILLILQFLLRPLQYFPKGKLIVIIISLILLWLYAILAGLSPSIVRAVTMFSALVVGLALNKPSNVYNSLFISMFFLLLIHPFYIFEVGFQLSYLAVFFIVWVQPKISSLWYPKYKIVNYFWQLFSVSLAAQIGVGALSVYYFHQFPGLFFISNLVIIPVLGLILICGIIIIFLSLLSALPISISGSYMFIIGKMNSFISFVGRQESFIAKDISISTIQLVAIYGVIISFILWVQSRKFKKSLIFISAVIVFSVINIYEKSNIESSNKFVLFQKNTKSLIGVKKSNKIFFYSSDSINNTDYVVKNFLLNERSHDVSFQNKIENVFYFENEKILIIDEKGLYEFETIKPSIIILQNTPKINIERLLKFHNPKLVIADGSNYKSFVEKWQQTCINAKTPFYSTLQKGAYFIKN